MKGLLEFQKEIYRSYSLSRYNTFNLKKLSQHEKDNLEIRVKVSEGSSLLGIDFQSAIETFMVRIAEKMEPQHAITIILGVAVLYFGTSAFRSYLDKRKEIRLNEIKSKETLALIHSQQFISDQETKRSQLMTNLSKQAPALGNMQNYSYDAHTGLLRSVKNADAADLQGFEIQGDVADELLKNARRKSHEVRLDGQYRILMVDATNKDGFKVKVMDVGTFERFNADVEDRSLDSKYKKIIQEAEWSKSPVHLTINAREVDGEVRKAIILSARKIAPEG